MRRSYRVQVVIDERLYRQCEHLAKRRASNVAAELRALAVSAAARLEVLEDVGDERLRDAGGAQDGGRG